MKETVRDGEISKYYVYTKSPYHVRDLAIYLEKSVDPSSVTVEFIGGQDRGLLLVCNSGLFYTPSIQPYIESFFRVPSLAMVDMAVMQRSEKLIRKHGFDDEENTQIDLLVDYLKEETLDLTQPVSEVPARPVTDLAADRKSDLQRYLASVISHQTGAATRSKVSLTDYLTHHHILLSTSDGSGSRRLLDISSRRLSEIPSLRELHIHGPVLPLLNVLLDLVPSSVGNVALVNTPRLLSLREESSARRLNDKANELIVDGEYKNDKSRTLLSKHSLNILLLSLHRLLHPTGKQHSHRRRRQWRGRFLHLLLRPFQLREVRKDRSRLETSQNRALLRLRRRSRQRNRRPRNARRRNHRRKESTHLVSAIRRSDGRKGELQGILPDARLVVFDTTKDNGQGAIPTKLHEFYYPVL